MTSSELNYYKTRINDKFIQYDPKAMSVLLHSMQTNISLYSILCAGMLLDHQNVDVWEMVDFSKLLKTLSIHNREILTIISQNSKSEIMFRALMETVISHGKLAYIPKLIKVSKIGASLALEIYFDEFAKTLQLEQIGIKILEEKFS